MCPHEVAAVDELIKSISHTTRGVDGAAPHEHRPKSFPACFAIFLQETILVNAHEAVSVFSTSMIDLISSSTASSWGTSLLRVFLLPSRNRVSGTYDSLILNLLLRFFSFHSISLWDHFLVLQRLEADSFVAKLPRRQLAHHAHYHLLAVFVQLARVAEHTALWRTVRSVVSRFFMYLFFAPLFWDSATSSFHLFLLVVSFLMPVCLFFLFFFRGDSFSLFCLQCKSSHQRSDSEQNTQCQRAARLAQTLAAGRFSIQTQFDSIDFLDTADSLGCEFDLTVTRAGKHSSQAVPAKGRSRTLHCSLVTCLGAERRRGRHHAPAHTRQRLLLLPLPLLCARLWSA